MPANGIGPLLSGVLLLMTGLGLLHTAVALRVEQALGSSALVGLVMSAYFGGLTLGSLRAAIVIERVGHIRAFAAFSSILAAMTVMHIVVPEGASWMLLRFMQGISMAGLFTCVESWLNQMAQTQRRGTLLSLYMIAVYGGMGLGQLLLMTGAPGTGQLIAAAAILMSFAVVPIALMRSQSPSLSKIVPFGLARLYAISPLGVVLTFSSGLLMGALYGVGPVFAKAAGLSLSQISLFMAALLLGGLALQFPIGRWSDHMDRRRVVTLLSAGLSALSVIMIPLLGASAVTLIILSVGLGGVAFTLYPLALAHINDLVGTDSTVAASGGVVLIYSLGAVIGPIVSAELVSLWGAQGFLAFLAVVGMATAVFGIRRMLLGAALPMEAQSSYVPVPRTTAIAMDPSATEKSQ